MTTRCHRARARAKPKTHLGIRDDCWRHKKVKHPTRCGGIITYRIVRRNPTCLRKGCRG